MTVSDLIAELQYVLTAYGDIPCQLQDGQQDDESRIVGYEEIFIVPEEYTDEGFICNIRPWPY